MRVNKSIAYTVLAGFIIAGGVFGTKVYNQHNNKSVHAQTEQKVVADSNKLKGLHKKFNSSDLKKADSQLVQMQSIVTKKSTKHDKELLKNDKTSFIKAIQKAQADLKGQKFDFNKIDDASKQFDDFAKQVASFKSLDKTELEGFKKTIQDDKKYVIDDLNKQKQEQDKKNEDQAQQDSQAADVAAHATPEQSQADVQSVESQATPSSEPAYTAPASSYSAPASSYTDPASSYSAPESSYQAPATPSYSAPAQSKIDPSDYKDNTVYYGKNNNGGYDAYGSNGEVTATIG